MRINIAPGDRPRQTVRAVAKDNQSNRRTTVANAAAEYDQPKVCNILYLKGKSDRFCNQGAGADGAAGTGRPLVVQVSAVIE